MKINNTRKHHHVWRHYLEAWSNGKQIFCKRKGTVGVICASLTKIANLRDFYKVKRITENDVKYLRLFVEKVNSPLREIDYKIIEIFNGLFHYMDLLKFIFKIPENSELNKLISINVEEKYLSLIEGMSVKYLDLLKSGNKKFFYEEDGNMEFTLFISYQFFRTRKVKDTIINIFSGKDYVNAENIVNPLRHILSLNMAWTFYMNKEEWDLYLLNNETEVSFITGDQPAINIIGDGLNTPPDFILYYPISPDRAIVIQKKKIKPIDNVLNKKQVEYYNVLIIKNSSHEIFSNSKSMLENIKTNGYCA